MNKLLNGFSIDACITMDTYPIALLAIFVLLGLAQEAGGKPFGDSIIFTLVLLTFTLLVQFWHISRDAYDRKLRYFG